MSNLTKGCAGAVAIDFSHGYRCEFKMRLLTDRVPFGNRQFVCSSRMLVIVIIPIAIMEGNENVTGQNVADANGAFNHSASRFNSNQIALCYFQSFGIQLVELYKNIRSRVIEFLRASGLRPRVKVIDHTAGGEPEGIIFVG